MSNLLEYENRYYDLGYDYIIGLDEAGRGPMAGELVFLKDFMMNVFLIQNN